MEFKQTKTGVEISNISHFDIGQILECGQAFRFEKLGFGHYELIAKERVLHIKQDENRVEFSYTNVLLELFELKQTWLNYFDLHRDYGKIQSVITKKDSIMQAAVNFAPGIRILQQDPWEMIISFIISQNNRIPQIKRVIANICKAYGTPLADGHHAFPTPSQLSAATAADLRALGTGYRDEYILDAVKNHENINPENLTSIKGIGDKVAHCIRLFGYAKHNSFPIDVWVRRVIQELYFGGKPVTPTKIKAFAGQRFGELAGFAQQYLFHYMRTGYEKKSI